MVEEWGKHFGLKARLSATLERHMTDPEADTIADLMDRQDMNPPCWIQLCSKLLYPFYPNPPRPVPPLPNPCFEKFHTPPKGPGATVLGEDPRCQLVEKFKMYGWGPEGRKGSMDW